jgi:hypothetical protein
MNYWIRDNDSLRAKEIEQSVVLEQIGKLKQLFNDPMDSVAKAKDYLTFLWQAIAPMEDIRLDLKTWRSILMPTILKPCAFRESKKVERACCGGKISSVSVFHCKKKNQPTTELGCSKCSL